MAIDFSNGSTTPHRSRVGIAFTPFETRPDVIARLAMKADELRLASVQVAEGWTHDALLLVADLALLTSHVDLGTSVISAWGRTPATMALAASSLQRYSSGRFSLGIGASSPPLTEGLHGIEWDRPVARLRETLTSLRALLAGARLPNPVPGAHPLRLGVVPEVPVPIVLAALSPASIRLAGELADGWTPFLWSRSRIDDGRTLLREGEARADVPTPTRVSIGVPAALGPNVDDARQLAAWWLSTYTTRMGPLYPRMLSERFGMAGAVSEIVDAARRGDGEQLPSVAEDLADEVTLMGTYEQAGELIESWFAAGADTLALVLPPGRPEHELGAILEAAADADTAPPCPDHQPAVAASQDRGMSSDV